MCIIPIRVHALKHHAVQKTQVDGGFRCVRSIVKDKGKCGYVGSFVDDLVDGDGSPSWCEAPSGSYRSYE